MSGHNLAGNGPAFRGANIIRARPLFFLLVVAPTLIAAFYYFLLAAPVYVSEASFVVRSPSQQQPMPLDSVLAGIGLGTLGGGGGDTNAFVVHSYIMSRDAVADLDQHQQLRQRLGRPAVDFMAKFPGPLEGNSFEDLYHAYPRYVSVGYDSTTGVSQLKVKAFRAEDASEIAKALLDGGEQVINRLNDRAAEDAIENAHRQVLVAEQRVLAAEAALTSFRNREQLIDPAKSSVADLDLLGKLEGQIATLRAQRDALAASAPSSPQLPVIDRQIHAFETQMSLERAKIAGDNTSLAPKIGAYERLNIEREFAAKELTTASESLESAREDASRKHLYLERVAAPNTPDKAVLPMRFFSVGMTFLTSLLVYGTLVLFLAGLREHGQSEV